MTIKVTRDGIMDRQHFAFDGTINVNLYDFLFHDINDVKPLTSAADSGVLATNVASAVPKFAGLAHDYRTTLQTNALTNFPVLTDVQGSFPCVSNTFEAGDMLTFTSGVGTALANQKLDKTTDPALCVGYVTAREANAVTQVNARLIGKVSPHAAGSQLQTFEIAAPVYPGAGTTRTIFQARENLTLMQADVVNDVAQNITGTLVKAALNAAPAAGTTPWCNANAINFNTAANTSQPLTLTSTVADLNMVPGDKAGIVFNAALNTGQSLVTMRFRRFNY